MSQSLLCIAAIFGFAFLLSETVIRVFSMLAQVSWIGFTFACSGLICMVFFLRNYRIPKFLIRITEQDNSSEVPTRYDKKGKEESGKKEDEENGKD